MTAVATIVFASTVCVFSAAAQERVIIQDRDLSPVVRAQIERDLTARGLVVVPATEIQERLSALGGRIANTAIVESDQARARARELFRQMQLAEATRELDRAVLFLLGNEVRPVEVHGLAQLYFERALVNVAARRGSDAERDLIAALTLEPEFVADPSVHGPPVLRAIDEARAELESQREVAFEVRCQPQNAAVRIDGRAVEGNRSVVRANMGHLVSCVRFGFAPRSAWIRVGSRDEETPLSLARADEALLALQIAEGLGSSTDAARLSARIVGAPLIATLVATNHQTQIELLDASTGAHRELLAVRNAERVPVSSPSDSTITGPLARSPAPDREDDTSWYERWYVWTLVGAVVIGAVVVAIVVSPDDDERVFEFYGPP